MLNGPARSLRMPLAAALATVTASICLGPAFLTGRWFFPSAFAVLAVGVGSEVARRLSTSRSTVTLGGLVGLLAYLLLRYAQDQALFGVVPWLDSVDHLGKLAADGRRDIDRYASPIGVSPGIEFITVAGIGLIALAVDALAVTWRRAALAGLPLLILYTVPTTVAPEGVSWVAFAVAGAAFLVLLLSESRERVSRWGRPMRFSVARENFTPEVETAPLGQVGRRVGATALGLALVVPAVLPDVTASTFGLGGTGFGRGGGGGGSEVEVVNPILDLGQNLRRGEDKIVLRYRGQPTYLRMVGLDEFNGDQWRPSALHVSRSDNDVEDGLSKAPGLDDDVTTHRRRYRIEVFDFPQTWLPLPYPTRKVSDIDGTWLYDRSTFNVFGENSSTRQISYRVTAQSVTPTAAQLRSAGRSPALVQRYLQTPSDLPPRIEATARDIIGTRTNHYDQALALQDFLRDPQEFTYSEVLDPSVSDSSGGVAILAFLQTRRGFCVQFASAMAVMARTLDIPARVAVGFAAGTPAQDGSQLVGLHDLHAWPELYFEGVGWVAFEPTPGGPASPPPSWARASAANGGAGNTPGSQGTTAPGTDNGRAGSENSAGNREPLRGLNQDAGQPRGGIVAGPVRIPVIPLVIALVALVLLAVPGLIRLVVRRRRWRAPTTPEATALAAWADLHDTLLDFGYDWDPSDSPRRGAARLARERSLVGEPAQALRRLAIATEVARYAPEMSAVGNLRADVDSVRAGLADGSSRWGRWRARLFPRSTRAVASAASEAMADGLDAIDAGFSSVTGIARGRRDRDSGAEQAPEGVGEERALSRR